MAARLHRHAMVGLSEFRLRCGALRVRTNVESQDGQDAGCIFLQRTEICFSEVLNP